MTQTDRLPFLQSDRLYRQLDLLFGRPLVNMMLVKEQMKVTLGQTLTSARKPERIDVFVGGAGTRLCGPAYLKSESAVAFNSEPDKRQPNIASGRLQGIRRTIGGRESEGEIMARIVAEMTAGELKRPVGLAVEERLIELLGDPDEGLVLRESLRKRLLRQKQSVAKGERGDLLEDVVRRLKPA